MTTATAPATIALTTDETTARPAAALELLGAADAMLATFATAIDAVVAAGEEGTTKRLADAMAKMLEAVAERIKSS